LNAQPGADIRHIMRSLPVTTSSTLRLLAMKTKMRSLMPIRLSRMGVALVGICAFLTAVAVIAAFGASDFKGHFDIVGQF
jgi:hypothetical protein